MLKSYFCNIIRNTTEGGFPSFCSFCHFLFAAQSGTDKVPQWWNTFRFSLTSYKMPLSHLLGSCFIPSVKIKGFLDRLQYMISPLNSMGCSTLGPLIWKMKFPMLKRPALAFYCGTSCNYNFEPELPQSHSSIAQQLRFSLLSRDSPALAKF